MLCARQITADCCSGCFISLITIVIHAVLARVQLDSQIASISTYNMEIPTGAHYISWPTSLFFSTRLIRVLLVDSSEGMFPTACRLLINICMVNMHVNTPNWHLCLRFFFFPCHQGQAINAADTITIKSKGKKKHPQVHICAYLVIMLFNFWESCQYKDFPGGRFHVFISFRHWWQFILYIRCAFYFIFISFFWDCRLGHFLECCAALL